MPQTTITALPKSEVQIEFLVTQEEAKPYIEAAAQELSSARPIQGFRPGKAPLADVIRTYGEMKVLELALERVVRAFYVKTILANELDTVGSPAITIDQLTPGQDIKFTIVAPVEPKILQMPDYADCSVTPKAATIGDKEVGDALDEMRRMRRKEVLADRAATLDDLVLIDLEMKKDHVTLEGGTGRDYRVYLSEDHYIPGFAKELEGMRAGESRTFTLTFPEQHFQKHLAGQPVDFTATAKSVFALEQPTLDDAFAKEIGVDTLDELKSKLKDNLEAESARRVDESAEIEMIEKLIERAKFDVVPDILVNEEVRRMMQELQHGVEDQGMSWNEYLASIKKSADELKLEFAPQAVKRVQTAVLIKQVAKKESIVVSDDDVDTEVDRILSGLRPDDTKSREQVASPEYREYIAIQMRNRKTIEWLKEKCFKTK